MVLEGKRTPQTRRSWLFLAGAERDGLEQGPASRADVLIQELEDFTPPERREEAREIAPDILRRWNESRCVSAVRINPLEVCGLVDLRAVMPGRPQIVMMSMVSSADQVRELDSAITSLERELGLPEGTTEIVPNIETAKGLIKVAEIASVSPRVSGLLVAAEDMVADLGGERTPEGHELAYVRSRFLVECVAAGVLAIDCPYTYRDQGGLRDDVRFARNLGYKAKSLVEIDHVRAVNELLSPSVADVEQGRNVVEAFELARREGRDRAEVGGLMIEVPTYKAAKRLLQRHEMLSKYDPPTEAGRPRRRI